MLGDYGPLSVLCVQFGGIVQKTDWLQSKVLIQILIDGVSTHVILFVL
jgi:hypothetical protein